MAQDDATLGAQTEFGALLRRCQACHQNALEGFPAFAAAVLAVKLFVESEKGARTAAVLARRYLLARFVYTLVYIGGAHKGLALARMLLWSDGIRTIFSLFGHALGGAD